MAEHHSTQDPPGRVQLQRTKGWRMPPNTRKVDRTTRWGNPFKVGKSIVNPVECYQPTMVYVRDAAHAVKLYRHWLRGSANRVTDLLPELGGSNLACWCPVTEPCHADVLLELANPDTLSHAVTHGDTNSVTGDV